jgi:hypothetical protein
MSPKLLSTFLTGLSCLAAHSPLAAHQPQGQLIELNSCEVYAGGCVVSSEATLNGRYRLQAWDVTAGSWQGTDLSGLQAVVLETATENLAAANARADRAVIYLPEDASAEQRRALLAWLQSSTPQLTAANIETRVAPVVFTKAADSIQVQAGRFVSFRTVPLGDCADRACGEALWYEPSTTASLFTVALNAGSQVNEPLLQLTWSEHGKRSVFVARFGADKPRRNLFVQASDWCGSGGSLF